MQNLKNSVTQVIKRHFKFIECKWGKGVQMRMKIRPSISIAKMSNCCGGNTDYCISRSNT